MHECLSHPCIGNRLFYLPGISAPLLTSVLRFPLLSLATDTDTEREKYFPGDALLGRLDIESWEPDKLRSKASPEMPVGMDEGLRVVCIL